MLQSVRDLFRFRIRATDGRLGKLDDFYFEDRGWGVRYIIVNTGRWLPASRVLVPPNFFGNPDPSDRCVPVSLTKAELGSSAGLEQQEPLSLRQEKLLYEQYGVAPYSRGGGPMGSVHGVVQREALALAEAEETKSRDAEVTPEPPLRSAREVIGYKIEAVDGPLGGVDDFLLDDDDWLIHYLVVNTKDVRLPNPKVLVPPSWAQHVSWSESRIHMRVNRDKIKGSQRYDPTSHSPLQKPKPFIWP